MKIKVIGNKNGIHKREYYSSYGELLCVREYNKDLCIKEIKYRLNGEISYISNYDEGYIFERIIFDEYDKTISYIKNIYYLKDINNNYIYQDGIRIMDFSTKSKNGYIFEKTFYVKKRKFNSCVPKLYYKNEYNDKGQLFKKTEYGYEDGYHITEWDTQGNEKKYVFEGY